MSRPPKTTPFATILKTAEKRSGGKAKLAEYFPKIKTAKALKGVSDDRYLSLMCRRIFRAGLNHTVVDQKWPAFETVFHKFEPRRVRAMSDEALEDGAGGDGARFGVHFRREIRGVCGRLGGGHG